MIRASSTATGTYRSMTRRPPSPSSCSRKDGTKPRIVRSTVGKTTIQKRLPGSRRKSRLSALRTASVAPGTAVRGAGAGEVEEGVVEGGLGDAEAVGGDAEPGQQRDEGVDGLVGAVDDDPAVPRL